MITVLPISNDTDMHNTLAGKSENYKDGAPTLASALDVSCWSRPVMLDKLCSNAATTCACKHIQVLM